MKLDISRLIEFQRLLSTFSQIQRMVHRKQGDEFVQENDSEHSYNLAMTAWYLSAFFPELDRDLVIRYALAHDLVEAHAGDTYIYGSEKDLGSKQQREEAAIEKLKSDWPDFPDMTATIQAYEQKADAESRFIYALDKIMPIMLIYVHEGFSWKQQKVTVEMLHESKKNRVIDSPEIAPYYEALHALLLSRPDLIQPR